MNAATFDSLQFVRILRDKGSFTTEQAESLADAVASTLHDDLATKGDLRGTELSLDGKIRETGLNLESKIRETELSLESKIRETELSLEGKIRETELSLEGKIRETELRLESRMAETKADIIKWMFGTIGFQTIVIISAVIALAHGAR